MGHIRLGQLPRGHQWKDVIASLASGDATATGAAIGRAVDERLAGLKDDPGLAYVYWVLTRVTWLSQRDDFITALRAEGIDVGEDVSGLSFLSRITRVVERGLRERHVANAFATLAQRAVSEALGRAVQERAATLFGASGTDVQRALGDLSTQRNFARLARSFFGNFLGGLLQFVASKESANHVGITRAFVDTQASAHFEGELRAYAHQCARILEDYSGGWYSKHNWLGDIDERQASRFVAYALDKLRSELKASGSAT